MSLATPGADNAGASAALDTEQADHMANKRRKKNLATQSSFFPT
jgi:hypothetical protein